MILRHGELESARGPRRQLACPVCPVKDVPVTAASCPGCNTDLLPLHRVREWAAAQYNEALRLAEAGNNDQAISRAGAALASDPEFVPALKLLGQLLWDKGAPQAAMEQWSAARALEPEDAELRQVMDGAERFLRSRRKKRAGLLGLAAAGAGSLLSLLLISVLVHVNRGEWRRFTAEVEARQSASAIQLDELRRQALALGLDVARHEAAAEEAVRELDTYRVTHRHSQAEWAAIEQSHVDTTVRLALAEARADAKDFDYERTEQELASLRQVVDDFRRRNQQLTAELQSSRQALHCETRKRRTLWAEDHERWRRMIDDVKRMLRPLVFDEPLSRSGLLQREIAACGRLLISPRPQTEFTADVAYESGLHRRMRVAREELMGIDIESSRRTEIWEMVWAGIEQVLLEGDADRAAPPPARP